MNIINVEIGKLVVSNNTEYLETFVGSCVALTLYDSHAKIGGLAHILLPSRNNQNSKPALHSAKYADQAIEGLLILMTKKGAKPSRIAAKVFGGASIFRSERGEFPFNAGQENIKSVKHILEVKRIPITSTDVGMNYGRHVQLNLKSGQVIVNDNFNGTKRF